MNTFLIRASALLTFTIATGLHAEAHEHFGIGTVDTGAPGPDQGETLQIIGGSLTASTYRLLPVPVGQRYGGYYSLNEQPRTQFPNDYFTFVALSDGQALPAESLHAKTGAYLWMEISSVTGPAGASFGFWDEGQSLVRTTPNISFLTNTPTGGYKFEITEPQNTPSAPVGAIASGSHYIISGATTGLTIDPGEDPYGHIHNRGWTVDQPGDYFVGFRVYDMSTNGTAGGPIHLPSQIYTVHFLAVPEPASGILLAAGLVLCSARRRRN